jgi:hypothetical protein
MGAMGDHRPRSFCWYGRSEGRRAGVGRHFPLPPPLVVPPEVAAFTATDTVAEAVL